MKLSTRLLLPLLGAVAAVMLAYSLWSVRQREQTLAAEVRSETRAYGVALGLAIESAYRDPYRKDVQEIIDRLSRERTVYGVLIYDVDGEPVFLSHALSPTDAAPADVVERVLATGEPASYERLIQDVQVHAVLLPINDPLGKTLGAFEVTQSLSFLATEIGRTRQRFLLNTATLLLAITLLILLLLRRLVERPLSRLLAAVHALERGEMEHRILPDPGATELSQLAGEFNRMAERLQVAREATVREADERLDLERRLRETEKLAAVGNIAAGLAHEVGAPLHVIRGRAELLLRRRNLDEAERRNLRIIVDQIARITQIVRSLLDFARRRETRMDWLDAGLVLRGVVEFLDPELERTGVELVWEGASSAALRGDPNLLHQVFMNLIVNAMQAFDARQPKRRITVRILPTLAERLPGEGPLVVEIQDNGPGIPESLLEDLFEPFFTTKASGEGTGLGLAVARSIIEEHGGTITATNMMGPSGPEGALFRITLPGAASGEAVHA